MKFLAILTNFLLVIAVVLASLLLIADKTASAKYLESVAKSENIYQKVSDLLPSQIAKETNGDDAQQKQVLSVVQSALTPEYIQSQAASALGQLDTSIKSGSAKPVIINLDHIKEIAHQQGLKVTDDKFQPITIGADKLEAPAKIISTIEMVKLVSLIFAILLFMVSLFLSYWRKTYVALGVAFVVTGVIETVLLAALFILPGMVISKIDFGEQAEAFSSIVVSIVNHIVTDLRIEVGTIALIFFLVGTLLLVFGKHIPGRKQAEESVHPDSPSDVHATNHRVEPQKPQMDSVKRHPSNRPK